MPQVLQTVTGPIPIDSAKPILPHEHIMVDFGGADVTGTHRWNRDDVIAVVTPYLMQLADRGWKTLVECTPKWLGRDVRLLRELSEITGLHIVTNTGLYKNQYLPAAVNGLLAQDIAEKWIRESVDGIDGFSWALPGFIKTAVDKAPLTEMQRTLLHAAAITSKETGLTIATHTEDAAAAMEILEILDGSGVNPRKWIYVHAHLEPSADELIRVAQRGCWIELDGIGWGDEDRILRKFLALMEAGYGEQILLSHDAGWYHVGEPGGGDFKPYTTLADQFLPVMKNSSVPEQMLDRVVVENPAIAFAVTKT